MKYGKLLKKISIPEWSEHYIDYDKLKKVLKELKRITTFMHRFKHNDNDILQPIELLPHESKSPKSHVRSNLMSISAIQEDESFLHLNEIKLDDAMDLTFQQCDLSSLLECINHCVYNLNEEQVTLQHKIDIFELEKRFMHDLENEINKISKFYSEQKTYFAQACQRLFDRLRQFEVEAKSENEVKSENDLRIPIASAKGIIVPKSERRNLKKLFTITYHGLTNKLGSYRIVNMTAIRKICKKHDKNSVYEKLQDKIMQMLESGDNFGNDRFEKYLIERVETAYAYYLSSHTKKSYGVQKLRKMVNHNVILQNVRNPKHRAKSCLIGFFVGCCISMLFNSFILLLLGSPQFNEEHDYTFWSSRITQQQWYTFSASMLMCAYMWFYGVDLYIFEHLRFNHSYIFEADPSSLLHSRNVFSVASRNSFFVILMVSMYIFAFIFEDSDVATFEALPLYVYGLIMVIFWSLFVIYPGKKFCKTRNFLLVSLSRIIRAPFARVYFIDFFIADQLTSLFIIFVDIANGLCGFLTGEWNDGHTAESGTCSTNSVLFFMNCIKIYPYWLRFAQCVRRWNDDKENYDHVVNGGKYLSSILTVLIVSIRHLFPSSTALFVVRLIFGIVTTAYAYYWDIIKDWSLGQRKYGFLRKELKFRPAVYYSAMVFNFLFRISWALALFPKAFTINVNTYYAQSLLALAEILRRTIWNVFRLENEHINNCGKFRVVREVPPVWDPADEESDEEELES